MSQTLPVPPQTYPPAGLCANCGASLHGPYCSACGQADRPLDPPVRHCATEFAQELFDVDGRVLRSLRRVFFSPGFLTREHLAGRRVRWLTPLRLYLIASVAMFAVQAFVGDPGGIRMKFDGDSREVSEWLRTHGFSSEAELRAAVDAARHAWMPRVMFVLVPLFAWVVALVRRRDGRRYPAHLVFALHVHAAAFGMRAVTSAITAVSPELVGRGLDLLTDVYILGYIYLALRTAYGGTRWRAVRDTAVVTATYTAALIAATGAVVGAVVFGRQWLEVLGAWLAGLAA